ncbi:MAG: type 1 glutamine amidotransferase [Humidesulfovibrio sp.]|jgi:GMP synthase-like glutamine amidotransferase|uniref:type 1 glutamine amidotransferase n=1 Tax=Humidesulfovibrio sp. TaxID=2910988 RepID=UPI0027338C2F|nr:type 1 glutamine amidotransferase [Humidesulfovibrio sp.]MDP2847174.1 type 1 glutamine amidotransferase [Humidesulfovibrio sp.]
MLRLHGLRHESFENEAEIAAWAQMRGHGLTHTDLWNGETPPDPSAFDFLVVMGGPMNIYEEDTFPWLALEKRFLKASIDAGKLVIGVCLGAQLLADVLGGKVTKNTHREIGWHLVQAGPDAARSRVFASLPAEYEAFHWHGDTFAIPPGALWTAKSEACAHQAFTACDDRVVGLQFHLETNAASMAELSTHCADEIIVDPVKLPYVQSARSMCQRPERLAGIRGLLDQVLDNMAALG